MKKINKEVTILIPNYKTPEITKICMRLLRKNTNFDRVDVIVIDNNSMDSSVEYLRSLKWISLIERKPLKKETGPLSHSRALDLALKEVKTPFVLSIHTDTFIKSPDWLDVLLEPFKLDPHLAGVGSWKLESISKWRQLGHILEQKCKQFFFIYFGYKNYNPERGNPDSYYLRSHCALYKTSVIHQLKTNFSDGEMTAGKVMHEKIVDSGYKMLFLESDYLGQYIDHLNHATMVLNDEFKSSARMKKNGNKRIQKKLRGIDASSIINNNFLDL